MTPGLPFFRSKLHHPNIVTLFGVSVHAPYIDVLMEVLRHCGGNKRLRHSCCVSALTCIVQLCKLGSFFDILHSSMELTLKKRLEMVSFPTASLPLRRLC